MTGSEIRHAVETYVGKPIDANMGGANMRDGLLRVAEAMGTVSASGTTAEAIQNDFNGPLS